MVEWRTSLKRKKHQQVINKNVRAMNRNIAEDNIWKGRFEIRQIYADFEKFDDSSGAYMTCVFELIDKKTRRAKIVVIDESQFLDSDIWNVMNDFACEEGNLHDPIIDYRNVQIPPHSYSWWRNHWYQTVEV